MEKEALLATQSTHSKISSLVFLRSQEKAYRLKIKKQGRMIQRRKYLKQSIYDNNNIFQVPMCKFSRKSAQNIIWEKNYKLKMAINILREDNSGVKARLWNIEKQNRKMDKQIEAWNLEKVFACANKKPYIDMATVSRVFADQDYEIVSIKIDIARLERTLQEREDQIEQLTRKRENAEKLTNHLKHQAYEGKQLFLHNLRAESIAHEQEGQFLLNLEQVAGQLHSEVSESNQRAELLRKKIQLKLKANSQYVVQRENLQKQSHSYRDINQSQIDRLKQEMRRIKIQQQNEIKDAKKDVKSLKRENNNFQCSIQEDTGTFILNKIELNKQIEELLQKIQLELGQSPAYQSQILPAIQKLEIEY